ncbi:MAG: hypothetical protein V7629_21225 [Motiliproteus sp.]
MCEQIDFTGGTYSRGTLARDFDLLSEKVVDRDVKLDLYRDHESKHVIAVCPSKVRNGRYDIVADVYLNQKKEEVVREHVAYKNSVSFKDLLPLMMQAIRSEAIV